MTRLGLRKANTGGVSSRNSLGTSDAPRASRFTAVTLTAPPAVNMVLSAYLDGGHYEGASAFLRRGAALESELRGGRLPQAETDPYSAPKGIIGALRGTGFAGLNGAFAGDPLININAVNEVLQRTAALGQSPYMSAFGQPQQGHQVQQHWGVGGQQQPDPVQFDIMKVIRFARGVRQFAELDRKNDPEIQQLLDNLAERRVARATAQQEAQVALLHQDSRDFLKDFFVGLPTFMDRICFHNETLMKAAKSYYAEILDEQLLTEEVDNLKDALDGNPEATDILDTVEGQAGNYVPLRAAELAALLPRSAPAVLSSARAEECTALERAAETIEKHPIIEERAGQLQAYLKKVASTGGFISPREAEELARGCTPRALMLATISYIYKDDASEMRSALETRTRRAGDTLRITLNLIKASISGKKPTKHRDWKEDATGFQVYLQANMMSYIRQLLEGRSDVFLGILKDQRQKIDDFTSTIAGMKFHSIIKAAQLTESQPGWTTAAGIPIHFTYDQVEEFQAERDGSGIDDAVATRIVRCMKDKTAQLAVFDNAGTQVVTKQVKNFHECSKGEILDLRQQVVYVPKKEKKLLSRG